MTDWLRFFLLGPGAGCTAYLALQVAAAWKLVGVWRILALIPAPIMLLVGLEAVHAYRMDSNLWPVRLIIAGPMAGLYVGLVFVSYQYRFRRQRAARADEHSGDDGNGS